MPKMTIDSLPDLKAHPRYAAAIQKRAKLAEPLHKARTELREIQAAIETVPPLKPVSPSGQSAARAYLADQLSISRPPLVSQARQELCDKRYATMQAIETMEEALRLFDSEELHPAIEEAFAKIAPDVFESLWKPLVREVAAGMIAYASASQRLIDLAGKLDSAGLFRGPINHPRHFPSNPFGNASLQNGAFSQLVNELIADSYAKPGDSLFAAVTK